ncbi:hypothetical protein Tco_1561821 [Tanacetum coccineum]
MILSTPSSFWRILLLKDGPPGRCSFLLDVPSFRCSILSYEDVASFHRMLLPLEDSSSFKTMFPPLDVTFFRMMPVPLGEFPFLS